MSQKSSGNNSCGTSNHPLTSLAPTAGMSDLREGMSAVDTLPDGPPEGERWSSWDGSQHGPSPRPDWVITDLGAVDEDLGILKSGKEADVHVIRRWVPGSHLGQSRGDGGKSVWMAAKRFRDSEHRMFHRDAGYLEGRRVRRSREMRAMARRTEFGKQLISNQWASAEFNALAELWSLGLPVPYPVQINGNPRGPEFLQRDCHNMCSCFTSRGLAVDEEELFGDFMAAAMSRW